jgi:hypothetical protein
MVRELFLEGKGLRVHRPRDGQHRSIRHIQ